MNDIMNLIAMEELDSSKTLNNITDLEFLACLGITILLIGCMFLILDRFIK